MRVMLIAGGAALAVAASAPAAAAPRKPAAADPGRQICKSTATVGSRLARKRECHTAQEWEEIELQDRLLMSSKQFNGAAGLGSQETYLPPGRGAPQ